jgi:acyl dehydratase
MGGMYYEDFEVEARYEHSITRTITEMDNTLFSCLTMNCQPLHLDEEYAKQSPYGTRIVNSMFTLALLAGIPVFETTCGTTLGNLAFTDVTFPAPVFPGDTVRAVTRVSAKRESASRPEAGIVDFHLSMYNQRNELVCECHRVGLMLKRPRPEPSPAVPTAP